MNDRVPIYRLSRQAAIQGGELNLWRESYHENCSCARAIEKTIRDNFDGMYLNSNCARGVIDEYGFDRVNYVLANTLREKDGDGRFSQQNKAWGQRLYIPKEEQNWQFCVESHPAVLNGFIDEAREEWKKLGLYDASHCLSEKDDELDYVGKVVAITPTVFKDAYKTPEDQLFLVTGGFGSHPNSRGRKVYGKFLKDGEETYYNRSEIIGIVKEEFLPDWAQEKMTALTQTDENIGGMTLQ